MATKNDMSDKPSWVQAFAAYGRSWPLIGVVVITISSSFWTFDIAEYFVIRAVYGRDAWKSGLRVTDRKGTLSDGGKLSSFHYKVLHYVSWLLALPFFFGSLFGLAYLNMRLHGKRIRDFARTTADP